VWCHGRSARQEDIIHHSRHQQSFNFSLVLETYATLDDKDERGVTGASYFNSFVANKRKKRMK
jgi:hypothetical protein